MAPQPAITYPRHRFPAEIIDHAVWLYHVFSSALRDIESILAERGVPSLREWRPHQGGNLVFARSAAAHASLKHVAKRAVSWIARSVLLSSSARIRGG